MAWLLNSGWWPCRPCDDLAHIFGLRYSVKKGKIRIHLEVFPPARNEELKVSGGA